MLWLLRWTFTRANPGGKFTLRVVAVVASIRGVSNGQMRIAAVVVLDHCGHHCVGDGRGRHHPLIDVLVFVQFLLLQGSHLVLQCHLVLHFSFHHAVDFDVGPADSILLRVLGLLHHSFRGKLHPGSNRCCGRSCCRVVSTNVSARTLTCDSIRGRKERVRLCLLSSRFQRSLDHQLLFERKEQSHQISHRSSDRGLFFRLGQLRQH
mmetsp:Transcript_22440/g.47418  ORF Transcript_22440/g.47418 Transcript_22440/m.47418 type:complete len:207 (-) Transcript_22440:1235-1855(-)